MQNEQTEHPRVSARSFALSVSGSGSLAIAAPIGGGDAHAPKFFPLTTIQSF